MSVAPLRNLDHLTLAAARLARAAPTSWDDFLKALTAVGQERSELCIQAPADQVVLAQGRAQQLIELRTLFTNAVAQANRLEANMKEKPHGR